MEEDNDLAQRMHTLKFSSSFKLFFKPNSYLAHETNCLHLGN